MERFAQILYDLGEEIGEKLYPDSNHICKLNYQGILHLQLEFDETRQEVLVASLLCDVPPGKYRELLLKDALKANNENPRIGTFGYSDRNNKLALFHYLYAPHVTGPMLVEFLEKFIQKALEWKNAVEKGLPLPVAPPKSSQGSIFGLKP